MTEIIIPTSDDAIAINKRLGGSVLNRCTIEFLIAEIESKIQKKECRQQIATISAILWYEIIRGHPFVDGNKRTATETVKLFLKQNNFKLNTPFGWFGLHIT